jgi:CheY-like chemotaxis protein
LSALGKGSRSEQLTKILLVDDDQYILHLVKNLLEQEGMSVQCAANGAEALAVMKQKTFDLMITDFEMPGLDGLSLTRQATVIAPDMPVIMMTGNVSSELPHMAKKAGVAKVLGKPFNCKALLEIIFGLTGRHQLSPRMLLTTLESIF